GTRQHGLELCHSAAWGNTYFGLHVPPTGGRRGARGGTARRATRAGAIPGRSRGAIGPASVRGASCASPWSGRVVIGSSISRLPVTRRERGGGETRTDGALGTDRGV